ncbi:MAG: SGNH/GDSL hydrolase family protein [Clostridia bacterium]|nr:SGNH/GDSL hydrolase family protein [Clostridia bacterium]
MKLNFEQISKITQGAVEIQEDDGVFSFFRFRKEEANATNKSIARCTAGIELNFRTDATALKLAVDTSCVDTPRSFFAVDVFSDGFFIGCIQNLDDADCVGDYANKTYPTGSFDGIFSFPDGNKHIRIVLPHSLICKITDIELIDASFIEPIKKQKRLLAYGDSITQGYDSLHPSNTYAMRLAESFDAELINKGIGGECFKREIAETAKIIETDYITVAYGINDFTVFTQEEFRENCTGFISVLAEKYKKTPIFVITPIWSTLRGAKYKFGEISDVDRIISEVCTPFNNIKVIHGWDLVPHEEKYFGDLYLHPNDEGFEHYFKNLKKETGI